MSEILLRRDRPDIYHSPAGATSQEIRGEDELIEKAYLLDGVTRECLRVSDVTSH